MAPVLDFHSVAPESNYSLYAYVACRCLGPLVTSAQDYSQLRLLRALQRLHPPCSRSLLRAYRPGGRVRHRADWGRVCAGVHAAITRLCRHGPHAHLWRGHRSLRTHCRPHPEYESPRHQVLGCCETRPHLSRSTRSVVAVRVCVYNRHGQQSLSLCNASLALIFAGPCHS